MAAGPNARAHTARARTRRAGHRVTLGRTAGVLVAAGALLASLAGCSVKDWFAFGWPHGGITPQAHQMYNLWIGSTIAALAVGVFVWALIFWCVVRYRKRGEQLPPQTRYNMPIEVLYTAVPFLVVAVLFYYTAITESYVNREPANPDVTVQVVAFKWNWQFNYPTVKDNTGAEVSTTGSSSYIPVLVLPEGKRIRIKENSKDVIHSFWVPQLLFKRDVIPGVTNSFEVTLDKTGSYVGRCAELCGAYHSQMNFELRSVTPEKYQRWLKDKQQGMSTPQALQDIGESPLATTTHPFDTDRTARKAS